MTHATEYLSEEGLKVGRFVEKDIILMTCIAGSLCCIGNVAITDRKVAFNQQINGIETYNHSVWIIYWQFRLSKQYIQRSINMAIKRIMNKGQL